MIADIFNGYYDKCRGQEYPRVAVLNPRWKPTLRGLYSHEADTSAAPAMVILGAVVRWDEKEPDFRFEDIR